QVKVVVRDEDLAAAQEILARPVEEDESDTPEDEREFAEHDESQWRCPRCKKRSLEVLPLSKRWRRVRAACPGIFLLPFAVLFIEWLLPSHSLVYAVDHVPDWWGIPWILIVAGLACPVLLVPRKKRCPHC